ncbi:MAG TPA: MBL fold metallo-hydrolase [Acidimicrobiia bacterium]|nr:MBL fold metallo-hydrolase [Acidimicrobiia bacterium]
MAHIRRLTDSCLHVVTDEEATLFDPGFHTFLEGEIDLGDIGEVTRVLISHEHGDHVHPDFVKWLVDRGEDVTVYSNQAVVDLLAKAGIESVVDEPNGVTFEDVLHGMVASGAQPPNRSYTIDGLITHPGDSREPTSSAPVLALPLIVPWDSATGAVEFARRLGPSQVVPIHDFYMSESGRSWIQGMIKNVLAAEGIELVDLNWGDGYTV